VTCVIPDSLPEANCSDLVLVQRPLGFISQYGAYFMNSIAKRHISAGKVGVALTHFNTKSVAALPIPLPPLVEQRRIVEEVERRLSVIDELAGVVAINVKRAERMRLAILNAAFNGNIAASTPNRLTSEPPDNAIKRESIPDPVSARTERELIVSATPSAMLADAVVLHETLRASPVGLSPIQLLRQSGHGLQTMDAFYAALKQLVDGGKIRETRDPNDPSIVKLIVT
jgi:hypothetical protein